MIRLFQHLPTTDDVLNRIQRNTEDAFRKLIKQVPILDGHLLTDVAIGTTTTRIDHGLGRKPLGWIVVGRDVDSRIWDAQSSEAIPNLYLALLADTPVTASLWIF